jgi:hypothetical protein
MEEGRDMDCDNDDAPEDKEMDDGQGDDFLDDEDRFFIQHPVRVLRLPKLNDDAQNYTELVR